MNLHQVLTGAVNPGDHCFSVGSVGDQRFTVSEGGSRVARGRSAPLSQPGSAQMTGGGQERLVSPTGAPASPAEVPPPSAGWTWPLRAKEALNVLFVEVFAQSLNSECFLGFLKV